MPDSEALEAIRASNAAEIPDEPCRCGRSQVRDFFGTLWPECLYFDAPSMCRTHNPEAKS